MSEKQQRDFDIGIQTFTQTKIHKLLKVNSKQMFNDPLYQYLMQFRGCINTNFRRYEFTDVTSLNFTTAWARIRYRELRLLDIHDIHTLYKELHVINAKIEIIEEFKHFVKWTDVEIDYFEVVRKFGTKFELSYGLNAHYRDILNISTSNEFLVCNPHITISTSTETSLDEDDTILEDTALAMIDKSTNKNTKLWLGDTGASCHMTYCDKGMYDFEMVTSNVTVGNGSVMKTHKIGKKKLKFTNSNGKQFNIIFENCKYIPDLHVNLFSITQALSNGWTLTNKDKMISLHKNHLQIDFDRNLNTQTGYVPGVYLDTCNFIADISRRNLDINIAHQM
jgi:hypothetical protein